MEVNYLFSSQKGDVSVSDEMLQRPFVVRPMETHPFLTLGDFLKGIRDFLWQEKGHRLKELIQRLHESSVSHNEIRRLRIRYEKYGTLYQISSAEIDTNEFQQKFAVIAAMTSEAREALDHECALLDRLNDQYPYFLIPRIYMKGIVSAGHTYDQRETFNMALSNWFEGFHEWHFSGKKNGAAAVTVWDMERGFRTEKSEVMGEIILKASRILTLYYEPVSNSQIHPWHHGAGDFVVKLDDGGVDVRLISVRRFGSSSPPLDEQDKNIRDALLSFLLNMTLKMRLDKFEGMGEPVWADAFVLPKIFRGFFDGIGEKMKIGEVPDDTYDSLLKDLKGISRVDLREKLSRQIEVYRETDRVDFSCMKVHLEDHARELYRALQHFQ